MSRDLIDECIGTPPPSTVDIPGLVRRERRAGATRWAGIGAAAIAALAVTGILMGLPQQPERAPTAQPPAGQPPARFKLAADTQQEAVATAAHLATEINRAIAAASPATTWLPDKPGETGEATVTAVFSDGDPIMAYYFSGGGLVSTDGHDGTVTLFVQRPLKDGESYGKTFGPAPIPCGGEPRCTESTAPGGALVSTRLLTSPGGGATVVVRMALPGDRLLSLRAEAVDIDTNGSSLAVPPLSAAQVAAVAIDIAGHIEP